MRIEQILSSKPNSTIHYVTPEQSVAEAASELSSKRIGSLVVSSDKGKTLSGILSERDIVRHLGKMGPECLHMKVSEMMTENVKTIGSEMTAQNGLEIMSEGRFRHLPVVDDGVLIGLISIGDVVSARLKQMEQENTAMTDMISGNAF